MLLIPKTWSKGTFTFHDPLNTRDAEHVNSMVISVSTFGDVINKGRDPFTRYYEPLGLPKSAFDTHAQDNGTIVSLKSESGHIFDVPAHYIKSIPLLGGVPYEGVGLVLNLGPLATNMDLTFLTTKITNLVKDNIGVDCNPRIVKLTPTEYLTLAEAELIESRRQTLITETNSDSSKYQSALADIEQLRQENAIMRKLLGERS